VTIHPDHPFESAAGDRDPVRRFRARLVAPVTLWAASAEASDGRSARAGFTVGSTTIADGAPACVLGMIDPEADLWTTVQESGRFTVNLLHWSDRNLADVFAGLAPAPGGSFAPGSWADSAYGPTLRGRTWAGCRLVDSRPVGYALLVTGAIEDVLVLDEPAPPRSGGADDARADADALARLRGRYTAVRTPGR
jgi:3-hydroxy-9,10-secoandrosta-1,3,5(10)-triene-9,17-dione monooxygenase reductase component